MLWGPGLGDQGARAGGGSFLTGSAVQPPQAILHRAGKVERHAPDALLTQSGYDGDFRFAGINDHYFIATVVKSGPAHSEFVPVTLPGVDGQAPRRLVSMALTFAKPPADVAFFVGPKEFDVLRSVDRRAGARDQLRHVRLLVVPLLRRAEVGERLRRQLRLVDHRPDDHHQPRSCSRCGTRASCRCGRCRRSSREVKAIQDRYAKLKVTDPAQQKMNQEMMALYKERGVNPASGCVPMLLTMPVLFAFYALLSTGDRAARRAVRRLDPRPVGARSVLRHADPDGRHACCGSRG